MTISFASTTTILARLRHLNDALARWINADTTRLVVLFILAHTLVWTLVPTISRESGALWDDMLEAYAWGQEWQLGYYKHPPLYAWIVSVWFNVFPRSDWAFYLLSAVNVGVGFAGIWMLAGRYLKVEGRMLSILLLTFMPYYNYMASNFNANTVLLSLWPWTAYAFVRSLETRSGSSGAAFGALAAAALLSKYYSILLLISCLAASIAHPEMRRYYTSPAPYVAVMAAVLLFAPHAWWAFDNNFPPIRYALGKTGQPWGYDLHKAVTTAIASLGFNGISAGILVAALRWRRPALLSGLWRRLLARDRLWILILASGPFFITILLGAAGYIKVAVNFLIPAFYMLPLLIILALEPAITRNTVRGVGRAVVIFLCCALLAAPGMAYASLLYQIKGTADANRTAARDATRVWHETYNVPVRIVGGSEKFSLALPFYGTDSPAEFTHFDYSQAPWITPERIEAEGLLTICDAADRGCQERSQRHAHAGTRRVEATIGNSAFGIKGPTSRLIYIMTPPRR
jgi:4-amino-4-deoxy-L-arabinose transferase-like glycosyltransferase